jgi:hypothetical protein
LLEVHHMIFESLFDLFSLALWLLHLNSHLQIFQLFLSPTQVFCSKPSQSCLLFFRKIFTRTKFEQVVLRLQDLLNFLLHFFGLETSLRSYYEHRLRSILSDRCSCQRFSNQKEI